MVCSSTSLRVRLLFAHSHLSPFVTLIVKHHPAPSTTSSSQAPPPALQQQPAAAATATTPKKRDERTTSRSKSTTTEDDDESLTLPLPLLSQGCIEDFGLSSLASSSLETTTATTRALLVLLRQRNERASTSRRDANHFAASLNATFHPPPFNTPSPLLTPHFSCSLSSEERCKAFPRDSASPFVRHNVVFSTTTQHAGSHKVGTRSFAHLRFHLLWQLLSVESFP